MAKYSVDLFSKHIEGQSYLSNARIPVMISHSDISKLILLRNRKYVSMVLIVDGVKCLDKEVDKNLLYSAYAPQVIQLGPPSSDLI